MVQASLLLCLLARSQASFVMVSPASFPLGLCLAYMGALWVLGLNPGLSTNNPLVSVNVHRGANPLLYAMVWLIQAYRLERTAIRCIAVFLGLCLIFTICAPDAPFDRGCAPDAPFDRGCAPAGHITQGH
jgi:hypothetical protein